MVITLTVYVSKMLFFPSIFNFKLSLLVSDSQIALLVGFHLSEVLKGPQPNADVKVFSFIFSHLQNKHPWAFLPTAAKLPTNFYSIHLLVLAAHIQLNRKEYKGTNEHLHLVNQAMNFLSLLSNIFSCYYTNIAP